MVRRLYNALKYSIFKKCICYKDIVDYIYANITKEEWMYVYSIHKKSLFFKLRSQYSHLLVELEYT